MNSTGEERPRRRLDPAFVVLGMGLLFLANGLMGNRPRIANMRPVDLIYLLGTGACLGIGLSGLVLHFVVRRKG
jgi:hypothetical protein